MRRRDIPLTEINLRNQNKFIIYFKIKILKLHNLHFFFDEKNKEPCILERDIFSTFYNLMDFIAIFLFNRILKYNVTFRLKILIKLDNACTLIYFLMMQDL